MRLAHGPQPSRLVALLDATVIADINGDGIPDIVLLSSCAASNDCSSGIVGFLLGLGNGTFQSSSTSQPLMQNTFRTQAYLSNALTVADFNNGGTGDLQRAHQSAPRGCDTH
jgi:hypothetical protein